MTALGKRTDLFDAFAIKAYDNITDTSDSSSVVRYLETMVAEYTEQTRVIHVEKLGVTRLADAEGRLAAYRDCLRVIEIAIDSALEHTPTT